MYEAAMDAESDFYGFEKAIHEVDGVPMAVYQPEAKANEAVMPANVPAKPVLILIHGFSANKDTWLRFAKHFSRDFQVYIPDMAGHGETGFKPEWDYSAPAQARRLLKLMNQLNIEQAHLVGHSLGGFVAGTMAVNYPHRIQSVVLMNPVGVISPEPSRVDRLVEQGKSPFQIHSRGEFAAMLDLSMSKQPYVPQPVREYLADQFIEKRPQLSHVFEDFHRKDLLEGRLDEFRMPVLVMWGGRDEMVSVSALPVWMRGVKNSRSVVYDDLGHMPMVEDPLRDAIDVWGFLNKLSKSS
jgi:pimeloyl-ACP methyl ester carboxylesterase